MVTCRHPCVPLRSTSTRPAAQECKVRTLALLQAGAEVEGTPAAAALEWHILQCRKVRCRMASRFRCHVTCVLSIMSGCGARARQAAGHDTSRLCIPCSALGLGDVLAWLPTAHAQMWRSGSTMLVVQTGAFAGHMSILAMASVNKEQAGNRPFALGLVLT